MTIRLIQTTTLYMESFMDGGIPKYAILSHTWRNYEEVSFQEMMAVRDNSDHPARMKSGYTKIISTCQRAREDGIAYAWVDTCCIDKTSSSELSEAINSMYRWYQKAEVCYTLFSDLSVGPADYESALPGCKWFTRGWCLQELVASRNMKFFDSDWNYVGSKKDLASLISKITRVEESVLVDNRLISSVPVARKMSWAATRETTRQEDVAYSLLGLFDVNMPMLYGEGSKAFIRLQQEIIKTTNDMSIFAFLHGSTSHRPDHCGGSYCDLFATSPRDFIDCENLEQTRPDVHFNNAFALTNKGLHFPRAELQVDLRRGSYSMPLNCKLSESEFASLHLRKIGPGLFARCNVHDAADMLSTMDSDADEERYTEVEEAYIVTEVTSSARLQLERADEYAIHVWSRDHRLSKALQVLRRSTPSNRWDASRMQFLTKGERLFEGYWKVFTSLLRRVVDQENGHQIPSHQLYLVCGLEHHNNSTEPRAWVRLYSPNEWKNLETKLGIVTNLSYAMGLANTGRTSDRIALGTGSTNQMIITATIRLENEEKNPHFELELDFEERPKEN